MADRPSSARISVRLNPAVDTDLAAELEMLGPYVRARRLVALARIGLAFERGELWARQGQAATEPRDSFIETTVSQSSSHQEASKRATKKAHIKSDSSPPTKEALPAEGYLPDLGDLWATGLMADGHA